MSAASKADLKTMRVDLVGSDLAASVRMPAHWCGLFGLKPTEGRVPNSGHIPEVPGQPHAVRHMNVLGPLTNPAHPRNAATTLAYQPVSSRRCARQNAPSLSR